MLRDRAWTLLALTLAGSGPLSGVANAQPAASDDHDVAGLYAGDLRGDALVWEDARFFLEPWESGTSLQFSSLSRTRRDEVGRAMPVKIVDASLRNFVEVELPNRSDCTLRRLEPDERVAGLRLFVRRSDLAPVVTKPVHVTYNNGTSVKLGVGMPVVPTATGHYLVSLRGDKLRVEIPHASVGYTYVHRPVVDEPLKAPVVRLDRQHTPRVDDVALEVRQYWVAPKPTKTSGENSLLKWSARCIEVVVAAPTVGLRPAEVPTPYQSRHQATSPPARFGYHVAVGTPLSTLEKREVAVAATPISVNAPDDERGCFDAKITMWPTDDRSYNSPSPRTFRLCAPAHLVVKGDDAEATATGHIPPPPDVAGPPRTASRTAKGVYYTFLSPKKSGPKPKASSTVKVHYTGWRTDGVMFDSSVKRGTPSTFPLAAVIAGWTDGLQVMAVGDRVRFWIPGDLAYNNRPGQPQGMLVFDVELLEITKP